MQPVATQVGMPLDEFIQLSDTEGSFEIINGTRVKKMPNVAGHGEIIELLYLALYSVISAHSLGKLVRELPFVLSFTPNWVTGSRIPDLMFFTAERFDTYKLATPDWKAKPYILVPDLAIEVVSPNDNLVELEDKVDQYLLDGVALVWVVDPQKQRLSVHRLTSLQPFSKQQTHLLSGDTLVGGDLIPGFELPVVTIFA